MVAEIGTRQCPSMSVDRVGKLNINCPPPWIFKNKFKDKNEEIYQILTPNIKSFVIALIS
jgi:hypothetical protein